MATRFSLERSTREMVEKSTTVPQEEIKIPEKNDAVSYNSTESTIFGKPQTRIDPDLKVCTHCKSKIKKMWSICPICGKNI